MKRVLEDELISLAERILKLKNRADIHQLKKETGILYEKLSILAFAELHFGGLKSDISKTEFKEVFSQQFSEIDQETGHYKTPDGMDYNPDPISEPNTEKIKDMVSQMPPESEQVDLLLAELEKLRYQHHSKTKASSEKKEKSTEEKTSTIDFRNPKENNPTEDDFKSFGVHFDDLPDFEPKPKDTEEPTSTFYEHNSEEHTFQSPPQESVRKPKSTSPDGAQSNLNFSHKEKRSLNDKLKKGIKIGLNDKIAFTKHLFGGITDDYDRVLSQLNTMQSFEEVINFIQHQIKPDYNNWEGKDVFEARFMEIVERKFE
jgi:hypothetical protein